MSTQRRVTAPPVQQAEVVTDSLRPVSLGTPGSTETDPGNCCAVPVPPHKEFRRIPPHESRAFAQGFLANLILPGIPGVGWSISPEGVRR
jgi:hypothetical protein